MLLIYWDFEGNLPFTGIIREVYGLPYATSTENFCSIHHTRQHNSYKISPMTCVKFQQVQQTTANYGPPHSQDGRARWRGSALRDGRTRGRRRRNIRWGALVGGSGRSWTRRGARLTHR